MNMKMATVIALCAVGGFGCPVHGEGVEVKGEASVAAASSYFWRGKEMMDSTAIQPQITLGIERWTVSVGGAFDIKGESQTSARSRIDAQADYAFDWQNLQFKVGGVARTYHNDPGNVERDIYEVYAQAVATDVRFLPSITLYYDFGKIEGIYASVAAGETWQVVESVEAILDVRLGIASSGFTQRFFAAPSAGDDGDTSLKGGLVDLSASLAFPVTYKRFVLTPKVEYVTLVDSALKEAAEKAGRNTDGVIGSLAISCTF